MSIRKFYTEAMERLAIARMPVEQRAVAKLHQKLYVKVKHAKIKPNMTIPLKRPFTADELLPIPSGYNLVSPGFVGISSARGGSTWWHNMILEHPQVVDNRLQTKELCYFYYFLFQRPTQEQLETYIKAFAAPEGCICGEWSPLYLHQPLAINYLHEAAPNTKFIAMVRNPIHRLRSELNQHLELYPKRQQFPYPVLANMGGYGRLSQQFEQVLNIIDRSNILVLQYEQCRLDPTTELKKTYAFLGIDESFIPQKLTSKINTFHTMVDTFDDEKTKDLVNYYRPDVNSIKKMFPDEIDLDLWTEFND